MSHVVVAPDKFKGSLTAREVARHLATGLRCARSQLEVVELPVADGGDGTLDAALASGFRWAPVTASGPTGLPVATGYAVRDGVAVIELADVSGLRRLPGGVLAPLAASSRGVGEVIASALDAGWRQLVVGLGGSACTDGGAGMVRALGARLLTRGGDPVGEGGGALRDAAMLDLSGLHPLLAGAEIVIASDVDNPLLGPTGAAAVYAPQKGARPEHVAELDSMLERWADLVEAAARQRPSPEEPAEPVAPAPKPRLRESPGAGAAGGVGFAAIALLGAVRRPGIDVVLDLIGFAEHLRDASLVVTGEGSLDAQSLHGKAPVGVAARAVRAGVPTVAVCGRLALSRERLAEAGFASAYALSDYEPDARKSMRDAGPLLQRVGRQIVADGHA